MSIANRVDSIETHLEDNYQGLINLGADLTGINKNIQNIRTVLDTIYNDLPKVTGEGTEVTLTPTRKGRLALIPKGNSEQESTEGKNILKLLDVSAREFVLANVTCTPVYDNNGLLQYFNLNGTASGTPTQRVLGNIAFKQGQAYTISGVTGFTITTLQLYVSSTNAFPAGNRLTSYDGKTTRTAQADETCEVRLYVYQGQTYNNVKIYPMVCENNEDDTYEPYSNGPAPSPEFPFPIINVTGNNNVVVRTPNLFDSDWFLNANGWAKNENGVYSGPLSALNAIYGIGKTGFPFITKFKEKTQYGIYFEAYANVENSNFRFRYIFTDGTYRDYGYVTNSNDFQGYYNISTTNKTIEKIVISYGNGTTLYIKNIRLYEYPAEDVSYVPYQNQTKPLNLGDIELNGIGDYKDLIFKAVNGNPFYDSLTSEQKALLTYGKWYKHEAIKKLVLNGTENWNINGTGTENWFYRLTYTSNIAQGSSGLSNYYVWENITTTTTVQGFVITTGYIRIRYGTEDTIANFKSWLSTHNVDVYYPLDTEHETDIEITDTTLISQLEDIDKSQSYNGTTIITSTFTEGNAQMIISASGLKGE